MCGPGIAPDLHIFLSSYPTKGRFVYVDEQKDTQNESLYGDVWLAVPVSWHLIGFSLLLILVAAMSLLVTGSYSRFEIVSGVIKPDLGAAQIIPSRPGIISSVMVYEGQKVTAAMPLVTIRAEEYTTSGGSGPENALNALKEQSAQLLAQERSLNAGAEATRRRLSDQASGIREEIISLDQQIATQRLLVKAGDDDYKRAQAIFGKGYLSKRDLQSREDALLQRKQQLSSLEQIKIGKRTSLIETTRSIEELSENSRATAANVASQRASVAQREFDVEASRGYTLRAPISGLATAMTARVGQAVQPNAPLMTIIPNRAKLEARLYVPTYASGFLAIGQTVRLQIDAFPYTRFGTIPATIKNISAAAFDRTNNNQSESVYLVTAEISDPRIYAFDRFHNIQPDMTLKARIITDRRSLGEWLFEPIFATQRR